MIASDEILQPWGFENTPSPNHDQLTALVHKLRHFSGYAITGPGPEFTYGASGATDDWAYATLGAASMTWEIGTFFHEDCSNFLGNVVPDNMDALTYAGMLAHLPYRFSQGPDIVHLALDSSVLEEGQSLTLSVEASDGAFSNSTLIEEASQQVMMILFFLDVNPYSMLQEDEWVLAANWLMAEDDLNENGKANWTVEWSDVQEILGNQTGSLEDQHLIYAMAIDQDGYPGVLSAVEFFFECSNCTMAPTSMTSDPPSMFPSSLPPTKMLGTSTPSVPKAETNPESLLEEGVTIAEVTDQSSAMASPLGSWRMIGLESSLTLLALFTMW